MDDTDRPRSATPQGRAAPSPPHEHEGKKARRNRRRPRRPLPRLTREGKAFVGVTLGVGFAAVNTGNNLLYLVLSFMLSVLLVNLVLSELTLRHIRVRRRLPPRAFVGSACLIELVLHNRKRWLPSFSLEAEDRAAGEPTERRCYFLKVRAGEEQTASYRRTPSRRGMLKLTHYRIGTRYPFGLLEKVRIVDAPAELLVYPALTDVQLGARTALAAQRSEVTSGQPGHGAEVAGVRDYRPEDEARSIHWRRTAALGRIVVREHEREAVQRLTLVLDNARPQDATEAWDTSFEQAVSRAASFAQRALDRGTAVEVRVRGAGSPLVLPGASPEPIWRFLALLETVDTHEAPPLPQPPRGARVMHLGPDPQATRGAA